MGKQELRPITSLGMFDLIKGVAIFFVIYAHSRQCFTIETTPLLILARVLFSGLFIASGYGIRKKAVGKAAKQVSKMFLKPYLYTAIGTVLCYWVVNSYFSKDILGALGRAGHILAGFAIGQYPYREYFGFALNSVGPMWVVVAIAVGWIILSAALKYLGEKVTGIICLALCIVANFAETLPPVPMCLCYLPEAIPGLYIGYMLWSHKLLEKKQPIWYWIVFALLIVFFEMFYLNISTESKLANYARPLITLAAYASGYGMVYIFTHINRRYNPVVGFFEWVGHNSMIVLSLHTIEYFGVHWHIFVDMANNRWNFSPTVGALVLFAIRITMIYIGATLITRFKGKMEERGIFL